MTDEQPLQTRLLRTPGASTCAIGAFLLVTGAVALQTYQYVRVPNAAEAVGSVLVSIAAIGLFWWFWLQRPPSWWSRVDPALAWLAPRSTRAAVVIGLVVFALTLFTATVTLQWFPNSADEYVELFQAATYAAGRLANPAPPDEIADAFQTTFTVIRDGRWVGRYPPGLPALLSATHALGLPDWALNPCLALLACLLLWQICGELELPPIASLACLWLATMNAFFIFNAGSYFAHQLVLTGALLFVLCGLRFQRTGSWRPALLAGVGLGVVGTTRHLEAVVIALPPAISLLWSGSWRHRCNAVWVLVGGAPFLAGLLWYHQQITGDPLLPPMVWSIPNDTLRWFAPDPEVHRLDRGVLHAAGRFVTWMQWTSPPYLVAYLSAMILLAVRRQLRFFDLYLPLLVCALLFYWGYGGNQYGPRYYHVALPFTALTLTRAALPLALRPDRRWPWLIATAFAITALIAQLNFVVWSFRVHQVIDDRQDLYRLVERQGLSNAVVLVADGTGPTYEMGPPALIRNGVTLDGPTLFALDVVDDATLCRYFSDRSFWRYQRPDNAPHGSLIRLPPPSAPRQVR